MKIDFNSTLKHIDGKDLTVTDAKIGLTLKAVCIEALMQIVPHESPSGEVKFKRYELALKVNEGGATDITPEEATMLKECIARVYGVAVVGPAWKLLNG